MATQTAVPTTRTPEELRAAFRRASRMPQLLEVRERTRLALRQVSGAMDDDDNGDNGDAELSALFAQLKGLLDEIDARITRQATIDDLDWRAAATPLGATGDAQWDRQCVEFSIVRAIAAAAGLGVDAAREREVSQELARRSGRSFAGIAVPLAALSIRARDLSPAQVRAIERRDLISTTTPANGRAAR